ncbi:MAG: hypothetical protein H0V82_02455 [Candidatus Protochlamydia sp.]|nr:hypothetical protein [Candidatus Protochlamydia sp.]
MDFIIKNKLTAANLSEFSDLTDDDLTKLVNECPNLKLLSIKSLKITEDNLAESLEKLTQLQHLNLSSCNRITGDKFAETFKKLTQL